MATHKCNQETRISLNEQSMAQIDKRLTSIDSKLDKFIEHADDKYASKLTEKIVFWLVTIILSMFIVAITALVYKW